MLRHDPKPPVGLMWRSRHNLYQLNGRILRFAIRTWIALIAGFAIADWTSRGGVPDSWQMLEIQVLVFSVIAVAIFCVVPWVQDPKGTYQRAISEPGDYQGICNRCAAFLPMIALAVFLFLIALDWLLGTA